MPSDHVTVPVEQVAVKTTLFPEQNVVAPLAVIAGAEGFALTVTEITALFNDSQPVTSSF